MNKINFAVLYLINEMFEPITEIFSDYDIRYAHIKTYLEKMVMVIESN